MVCTGEILNWDTACEEITITQYAALEGRLDLYQSASMIYTGRLPAPG